MKPSNTDAKLVIFLCYITAAILALLPFHAFLTVWLASGLGHYTLLRLWKEFLLAGVVLGLIYLLATDKQLRAKLKAFWPARLVIVYSLILLAWALVGLAEHHVTGKAMWYGLLVDLRFLVFFLTTWLLASITTWPRSHLRKIVFIPATLVAAIAVLQFLILPYDFLKHFGYGPSTIAPYETINHNIHHLRVAATLRGANPLGAYMVLPISLLAVAFVNDKGRRADKLMLGLGLLPALAFSFSRSAWIGALLSLAVVAWLALKSPKVKKQLLIAASALVVVGGLLTISLRHNTGFENVFLHTDHNSTIASTSDQGHSAAFKSAVKDIVHQPLGRGVGSAGPESVYNDHPTRIAENYFLQIGQEAGVIGMALFITICVVVGRLLLARRADPLALGLFASLIGLTLINLLSHAWTDDTLAYIWWGLAGIALAVTSRDNKLKLKRKASS